MKKSLFQSGVLLLLLALSGCGGSKMLKETEPLVVTKAIATASDQHLSATLDFVIVRNGPASKLLIRDTETGVRRTCCQLGTSHGPRMYLGKARFVNICIGYDQCDIS